MNRVAVVILNWNGMDHLRRFLPGVVEYSSSNETTVWLADNNSTDGSAGWVEASCPSVKVLKFDSNYGFAGGYNKALSRIEAEYFILLNSDVEVTPGWSDRLADFMDKHPSAGACQPKILSWTNRIQFEYAGAAGGFIDKYGFPFCRGRLFSLCENDVGQYDSATRIFWASGSCMIIRSEAWQRCGGLDHDFFAHMEEIDLCWRMHYAGYEIWFNPSVTVYHVGGGTLAYENPRKSYLNFRNSLFMLYKNLPSGKKGRIIFIRMILDGVAAMVFLFSGKPRKCAAVWNAHIDFYRSMETLRCKSEKIIRSYPDNPERMILNKSVVFEFYIRRRRKYSSLGTTF